MGSSTGATTGGGAGVSEDAGVASSTATGGGLLLRGGIVCAWVLWGCHRYAATVRGVIGEGVGGCVGASTNARP